MSAQSLCCPVQTTAAWSRINALLHDRHTVEVAYIGSVWKLSPLLLSTLLHYCYLLLIFHWSWQNFIIIKFWLYCYEKLVLNILHLIQLLLYVLMESKPSLLQWSRKFDVFEPLNGGRQSTVCNLTSCPHQPCLHLSSLHWQSKSQQNLECQQPHNMV